MKYIEVTRHGKSQRNEGVRRAPNFPNPQQFSNNIRLNYLFRLFYLFVGERRNTWGNERQKCQADATSPASMYTGYSERRAAGV